MNGLFSQKVCALLRSGYKQFLYYFSENGPKKLKFDLLKNSTMSVFEVFYISFFFCSDSAKIPTIAVYIDLSSYST